MKKVARVPDSVLLLAARGPFLTAPLDPLG
jgi:hypothetical protein